jgi:DNA repair exonuclease SbcCD nuclease subunit
MASNIAFIGDVHIGNHNRMGGAVKHGKNDRCRRVLHVYENAVTTAIDAGAKRIVVLGDLLDSMHPTPQMVDATRRVHAIAGTCGAKVILLKGNHDSGSDEPGDNAVSLFEEAHCIVVDTAQTVAFGDVGIQCLPFRSGVMADWLPDAAAKLDIDFEVNIAVAHAGIKTSTTAPWLASAQDALTAQEFDNFCDHHAIDLLFAGHWHEYQRCGVGERLFQLGAVCPTGFSNLGIDQYGKVAVVDTTKLSVKLLGVAGPRFLKFTYEDGDIETAVADLPRCHAYYIEYRARTAHEAQAAKKSAELLKSAMVIADYSISFDSEVDMAAAKEAAASASELGGIPAAVAAYVAEAVPKNMQASVLARAIKYLNL